MNVRTASVGTPPSRLLPFSHGMVRASVRRVVLPTAFTWVLLTPDNAYRKKIRIMAESLAGVVVNYFLRPDPAPGVGAGGNVDGYKLMATNTASTVYRDEFQDEEPNIHRGEWWAFADTNAAFMGIIEWSEHPVGIR